MKIRNPRLNQKLVAENKQDQEIREKTEKAKRDLECKACAGTDASCLIYKIGFCEYGRKLTEDK